MIDLVLALVLAAGIVVVVVQALRTEYLIVMRWPRRGWFVLARAAGERYRLISPMVIPLALLRFAGTLVSDGLAGLRSRWAHGRGQPAQDVAPAGSKA